MSFKGFVNFNRLRFFFITFLSILSGTSGILAGYVQMYWLTDIRNRSWSGVVLTTCLMGLCWFFAQSMIYYVQYLNNVQEEGYFKQLRDQIAAHYFKDGKHHKVADFQSRLTNDFSIAKDNFFERYTSIPFYGSMLVASLIALITIHWSIFVLSVVVDLISFLLPRIINKQLEQATINVSDKSKEYLNVLNKWFSGLNELRRYFAGAKLLEVQSKSSKELENANVKQIAKQQLLSILNGVGALLSTITLLGLTGMLVKQNLIIFGAILSVQNFANTASFGMQEIIEGLSMMRSTKPLMVKISKDTVPLVNKNNAGTGAPAIIATKNLVLSFPNGESLYFPDIQINQGEKVLLTGNSGVGKSTLFKLILGTIKPSKGKVEFKDGDGEDIKPNMSRIGYIPQDPNLFPGTTKQNITMFNNQLDERITDVVQKVDFTSDLKKFKDGLNEELNLNKLNISGGQRQKIVFARAEIYDSNIILIDEGTSAIDQKSTFKILKNLLKSKATIVFIAHSFSEEMRKMFDREIHLTK